MSEEPHTPRFSRAPDGGREYPVNCFVDVKTTKICSGFYRLEVLRYCRIVAEYFVVKGYPKKSSWGVLTNENHLQTHQQFKRLGDAKAFCTRRTS
ncbi:MAG: hypothetical protein SFV81_17455 [Pirellulaceae bacterium]|nr:hypothetical protein [Pirellulaceae bacterium]